MDASRGGGRGESRGGAPGTRRILVAANETVAGRALLETIMERAHGHDAEILVVCPALNSRFRHWLSDEDGARAAAQARLDASLAVLATFGVRARGTVGDADPVQAIGDALRTFEADEIVISTHPRGRSNWLEKDVVRRARHDYGDLRITHVIVDLEQERRAWAAVATPGGDAPDPQAPESPGGLEPA